MSCFGLHSNDREEEPDRVFQVSMNADRFGFGFALVLFTSYGIYSFFALGVGFAFAGAFALAFLFAYLLIRMHRNTRVREACFYPEWFEVRGKNLNRRLSYADVRKVSKNNLFPMYLAKNEGVSIWMRGEDSPIVIHTNARNRRLKIDLYSWLTHKQGTDSRGEHASD